MTDREFEERIRNAKSFDEIKEIAKSRDCTDLGSYLCCGFDTYGPFKIIGGLKKGHPTKKEIQDAIDFYNGLGA